MSYADMITEKTDIIIERMTDRDLPEVLAIEAASFSKPWSTTLFMEEIVNPSALPMVARRDGRIAGYLCAGMVVDEGHILDLAVAPAFRRQGVAGLLMRVVLDRLRTRGCRSVFLEVRVSHSGVISFYEKSGFRVIQTRKCYYVSPVEDAVIMVLCQEHP